MLFVPGFKQGLTETLEPIKKWYHDLGFTDEVDVKVYEVNSELLRRCGMPHLHAFAPPCIHFGYVNQDALKVFYTKTLVPILGEKYPSVPKELLPQLIWNALNYCLDGSGAPQPLLDFVAKHEGPRIYLSERMTSMIGTKRQIVLEATLAHEYLHVLQDANQQTERIPFSLEVFPFIASDLYGLSKDPDFEELDEETKTQLDIDASDDIRAQGSSATKIYSTIGQAKTLFQYFTTVFP